MKKIQINKSLVLQTINSKLICFDTDKAYLYTFNETGKFILQKVKLGWEEKKIVIALAEKYDIPLPTLKKDVKELIKDMLKNKIISPTRSK